MAYGTHAPIMIPQMLARLAATYGRSPLVDCATQRVENPCRERTFPQNLNVEHCLEKSHEMEQLGTRHGAEAENMRDAFARVAGTVPPNSL